jgi:integrase
MRHPPNGAVAQLGERVVRNDEVRGSIPLSSTNGGPLYKPRTARFSRRKPHHFCGSPDLLAHRNEYQEVPAEPSRSTATVYVGVGVKPLHLSGGVWLTLAMPKDFTTAQIDAITRQGLTRVAEGLYVQVRGASRTWMLRYRHGGRQQLMGLGPLRLFTLTEAKRRARAAQQLLADGINPKRVRDDKRRVSAMTFAQCATACIAALAPQWSNAQHRYQWEQTITQYANPVIGHLPVDQVDANHLVRILEPIWLTKTETATRTRERIERILDWATSSGFRSGDNPARWKSSLIHRLPKPSKVQRVVHHVPVPIPQAPAVYAALAAKELMSAKVARFIMLTTLRFGEAAHSTWQEYDLDAEVPILTVPKERMKLRKLHRVPLSAEALALLHSLRRKNAKPTDLVFEGQARGRWVSDTAVRNALRGVGPKGCDWDTHGLRSTFRDWVAEHRPRDDADAAEAALAHRLGDDTTTAYLRSDLFQRRVKLMEDWSAYLAGKDSEPAAL